MTKLDTLYKRDKTGKKILSYEIEIIKSENGILFSEEVYKIIKTTGFIDGKKQQHVDLITQGKQGRSVYEQALSEARSAWNSKRDEGYKTLADISVFEDSNRPNTGTYCYGDGNFVSLIDALLINLPGERTDASGTLKPMKCTALQDTKTGGILAKVVKKIKFPAYAQPKLDGVRCMAHKTEDGWKFTSSSGKSYDVVCRFIKKELNNLGLPVGTILDGELYIHGVPLQKISGWCRKETPIEEHKDIQYWIFDTCENEPFSQRLRTIAALSIEAYRILQFTPTTVIHTEAEIQQWHDEYTGRGYEGLIIRNADGKYAYGIRSSEIFKYKNFQDDEFVITGAVEGKRGAADMVFKMRTMKGQYFEAKPLGSFEDKENYMKDLDNIVGKMATVRFLTYSESGVPQGNPVLKCIRDYE